MAAKMIQKNFVLLIQFIIWVGCVSQHTYDIYPADMCPTDEECITLTEIVTEMDKYFASNATLVIHPGDHSLYNKAVSVADVRNLTLQGYISSSSSGPPNTKIFCVESSLSFTRVSELYIASINFVSCRSELSFTAAVFQDCSFENSTAAYGGAVAVYSGSNVQFVGHATFTGNQATDAGGAVLVDKSILSFRAETRFTENRAWRGGALYADFLNNVIFNGVTVFDGNLATYGGGAVRVNMKNNLTFNGDSVFCSNLVAQGGGAVDANMSNSLNFNGSSKFLNNTATDYLGVGGAFRVNESTNLSFIGSVTFESNTAGLHGGAMIILKGTMVQFSGDVSFSNSVAKSGGALYAMDSSILIFHGNSSFEGNEADVGGALYSLKNNVLFFNGSSNFQRNTAKFNGGALAGSIFNYFSFSGSYNFEGNSARFLGGAIYLNSDNEIKFTGNVSFSDNTASLEGGAIFSQSGHIWFTGNITTTQNTAKYGGAVSLFNDKVIFQGYGTMVGNNCTGSGHGGAMLIFSSIVKFNGSYHITGNTAGFGGGLAFIGVNDVFLQLNPNTNLTFVNNTALKRGGAIYVDNSPFDYCNLTLAHPLEDCFMELQDTYCSYIFHSDFVPYATGVALTFESNNAIESGESLYGGFLDHCVVCYPTVNQHHPGAEIFSGITNVNFSSQREVSSNPYKVCVCENNKPNCTLRTTHVQVYPGQVLSISVVAVGQLDGVVPSVIRAVSEGLTITSDFKLTQPTVNNKDCTQLQYPLLSKRANASLKLYSDEPCFNYGISLTVLITFLHCPVGFTLSDQGVCVCDERLQKYTQLCQIQNLTIDREQSERFWVGVEHHSQSGLILHPHCPFDYCTDEAVDFTLNSTDLQCSNGRSGMLCGACQSGHSLALGSSQCLSGCSNKFLALLLAFAVAGIALVAFLFLCNLTVAKGALNGLIFYANVLAVNQSVLFPSGSTNVLTLFIAWVNLDLGIEMCFFESLDTYSRTWLQFVFPIYICVLVGLIAYLAETSTTCAKIIGSTRSTDVLATLFLLSYTKLLRAIMVAFSFTILDYPNNESRFVWLYDGNIGYLDRHDGRHIVLFVISLLFFLFVLLPYTLLLLCGQWILRKLPLRWLSPTKQLYLKAFLDAYYAPFTDKHHYWTGLLLTFRCVILLISTLVSIFSPEALQSASLEVILCIASGMLVWVSVDSNRLYKKWYLDVLEASYIFNLTVLIGGTYQVKLSGGNQAVLVYTSVAIAFATFTGTIICSVVYQMKKALNRRRRATHNYQPNVTTHETQESDKEEASELSNNDLAQNVTYSVLEMPPPYARETSGYVELTPLVETPEVNT